MARILDANGYITIPDNPISKVGVFPYLGREIKGAPDPDKIYQVYRPEEELSDPECIESFKLAPFVDEHAMLGDLGIPPEEKGIQGVIGEQVYFAPPYLRGNLRIHSRAARALVDNGKIELSPGYSCWYDPTPGEYMGQPYQFVQRRIRGNHLALVEEGRTGPDVAVQDKHFSITLDSAEVLAMPSTLEELIALIEQAVAKALEASKGATDEEVDPNKPPVGEDEDGTNEAEVEAAGKTREVANAAAEGDVAGVAEAVAEAAAAAAEAAKDTPQAEALDGLSKGVKALASLVAAQDKKFKALQASMDSGAIAAGIADAKSLYDQVTPLVGNFDADPRSRTVQGIASYACDHLKLQAPKGSELATLKGYLAHAATVTTTASDSKAQRASANPDILWKQEA